MLTTSPNVATSQLRARGLLLEGETLDDLLDGLRAPAEPSPFARQFDDEPVDLEPSHLDLDDDEDLEDTDLDDDNPFEALRDAWQGTSGLAEWSRRVLDHALEVRLLVSLGRVTDLDGAIASLLDEVARRPTIGR